MKTELKCSKCDQKWTWFYKDELYCDHHLPCGMFKRFVGIYIIPMLSIWLLIRRRK